MADSILTDLVFWLPTDEIDVADELAGEPVPQGPNPDPLRPWFFLRFSRPIDARAYASTDSWGQLFLLTSLSHPAAPNVLTFTDFSWDKNTNSLRFRPVVALTPGDRYLAVLSGQLRDGSRRCISRSYSWTFTCAPTAYGLQEGLGSPLLPVTLFSPPDDTACLPGFVFTWSYPSQFVPDGYALAYDIHVATDRSMLSEVWRTRVRPTFPAPAFAIPVEVVPVPTPLALLQAELLALTGQLSQFRNETMTALRNPIQVNQIDAQIITGAATTAPAPLPIPVAGRNAETYKRTLTANLTDYSYATSTPGRIVSQAFTNSVASGAFVWTITAQTGDVFNAPDLTAAASFNLAAGESRTFVNTATGTWDEV